MREIIITDLTRFSNQEIVCIAGIDLNSGQCIRPMPYLPTSECKRLNILPGTILKGKFTPVSELIGPHQEDMSYKNLSYIGPCSSEDFKLALRSGLFNSIEAGFEIELAHGQKHIPVDHELGRSIITIQVNPEGIEVVDDTYKPGKVKLNFGDNSGRVFKYMAITDFGFHLFAEKHHMAKELHTLNSFIGSQAEIYLRIGLSRRWNNGNTDGYWT